MTPYPRDLHGHRPTPPLAVRPGAATISPGHESGGGNTIRQAGGAFMAAPFAIAGAPPWPEQRQRNGEETPMRARSGRSPAPIDGPRAKGLLP